MNKIASTKKFIPLMLAIGLGLSWTSSFAQQPTYLPFDESFSKQIILQEARKTVDEGEHLFSPNQLASVVSTRPDFTQKDPWSTTLIIQHGKHETLQLSLLEHTNIQVASSWINDELLHIKVWWGRVIGSDLILDLSTATFIYKRMFVYDLYTNTQDGKSLADLVLKLEHIEGASPTDFQRFELLVLETEYDTVRQFEITTLPPMISRCYLEASLGDMQAFESFLHLLSREKLENAPPRSLETVCRNCTIFELTWVYQGQSGSTSFSEQRPFRYPALDILFPLIETVLKRMPVEGTCDA